VCESSAAVVAEAELSAARPVCTARLVLDLGYATPEAAAVSRDLTRGVLTQIQALLGASRGLTCTLHMTGGCGGPAMASARFIGPGRRRRCLRGSRTFASAS
jgi:hypothetical protein